MYRDVHGPTKPVLDLNLVCARMHVHVVFGDITDFVSVHFYWSQHHMNS